MQRIRHIGLIAMVLVLASFLAPGFAQQMNQESKNQQESSQKDQKKVTGKLTNVDREGKTITVKTEQGDEMEFTFDEKTQVQGSETSLERLSGQIGNQVVVSYEDGWMTDTVRRIEIQSRTSQQASPRIGQQAERDSLQGTDQNQRDRSSDASDNQRALSSDQNQRTMDRENSSQTAQERDQYNRLSESTLSQQAARDDQNQRQDARYASQSRDDDQAGASSSLPQTASSLPEVALFGLLALVGAITLRRVLA